MNAGDLGRGEQGVGRLAGMVAIITGASSGIGRAIAVAYARENAKVVIADRSERSKASGEADLTTSDLIRNKFGQHALFVLTDVCSSTSMDELVKATIQRHERLDMYIVNAAGIAPEIHNPQPIWSLPESTWTSTMGVNATGVLNACRAATAQMMEQPALPNGDRGWVVNISSIYGQTATPGNVAYCASKHAVLGLTKAAALDCAPHNIRVNAICPGFTETALTSSLLTSEPDYESQIRAVQPLKGVGSAADIARVAVVLGSTDAGWITGTAIAVDGGFLCQ